MADLLLQSAVKIVDPTTDTAGAAVLNTTPSSTTYGLVAKGDVKIRLATDYLVNGTVNTLPIRKIIAFNSTGNNIIQAGLPSGRIRLLKIWIRINAATNFYFRDGGGSAVFGSATYKIIFAAAGTFALGFSPIGWFQTNYNSDLIINQSTTAKFSGNFSYVEII